MVSLLIRQQGGGGRRGGNLGSLLGFGVSPKSTALSGPLHFSLCLQPFQPFVGFMFAALGLTLTLSHSGAHFQLPLIVLHGSPWRQQGHPLPSIQYAGTVT